ncbi:hypothetical protein [Halalkalicoccus salilacus]|uniref:hypothetical protein n=1 Tax=Halalkalicoccus salilacus TaxID=3117459 RepID=UPI00300E9417
MARELGPKGIHVAHVLIDEEIETPRLVAVYPDRDERTFLDQMPLPTPGDIR